MMDCAQSGAARAREPNNELAPVPAIARSTDQTRALEPRESPAQRLALDMDGGGKLFLVEGARGETFHGNGSRASQSQRGQHLIMAALDHSGGLAQKPVTIPAITPGVHGHRKPSFPSLGGMPKASLPLSAAYTVGFLHPSGSSIPLVRALA
jgi:hypothetical protein